MAEAERLRTLLEEKEEEISQLRERAKENAIQIATAQHAAAQSASALHTSEARALAAEEALSALRDELDAEKVASAKRLEPAMAVAQRLIAAKLRQKLAWSVGAPVVRSEDRKAELSGREVVLGERGLSSTKEFDVAEDFDGKQCDHAKSSGSISSLESSPISG